MPAVIALLALGCWLRLTILAGTELGLDGLLSVGIAHLRPLEILDFSLRDVHPPLYYLLLSLWLPLAGPSFPAARWPSVAAGVLALAVWYRLLAGLGDGRVARTGLWLLALAPGAVFLAATVRDFALGVLLSLLSWLLLQRIRRAEAFGERSRWEPIALAAVTAAAWLTWYFHLLIWPMHFLVAARGPRRALAPLIVGAALALPWYVAFLARLMAPAEGFGASGRAPETVRIGLFLTAAGRSLVGDLPWGLSSAWLLPLWIALVVWSIYRLASAGWPRLAGVLAALTAAGLATAWVLFRFWVGGDFLTRYFLVPAFAGGAALACLIGSLSMRPIRWAALSLLAASALLFYVHYTQIQTDAGPRADLQAWLEARLDREDAIIFDDLADLGYFWLADRTGAEAMAVHAHGAAFLWDTGLDRVAELAAAHGSADRTIWRVRQAGPGNLPSAELDATLVARWQPMSRRELAGRLIEGYRGPAQWQPTSTTFGNLISLQAVSSPDRVEAGNLLPVVLRWQAAAPIDREYTVFVHVLDETGRRVGQHDGPPVGGHRPTTTWPVGDPVLDLHWVELGPDTPSGRYQVVVGLYHGDTRLALPDGTTAYAAKIVEVSRN